MNIGIESKQEQLQRMQEDELRKIGSRMRQKAGPPATTSLEDLELARTPSLSRVQEQQLPSQQRITDMLSSVTIHSEVPSTPKRGADKDNNNPGWATRDEIRQVQMETESNGWGSELPSDASIADDDDSTKRMHHGKLFKHNPLKETGFSLAGWDGNWQPPPVDWHERPQFNNNSLEYKNSFNHWLDGEVPFQEIPKQTILNLDLHPDGLGFVSLKEGVNERNASRKYGFTPDVVDIVRHVTRLDDFDYLKDWGKLDMNYGNNARFQSETAESLVTNWVAQKQKIGRTDPPKMSQLAKRCEITTHPASAFNPEAEARFKGPTVNIYLRPAVRTDVEQLTELYNWYVVNSPRTTDIELIPSWEMRGRIEECLSAKLPFIVAVSREHKSLRRLRGMEKIVGFASATDFSHANLTERISAELEVYIHQDWVRKGVGRTLLDKLLDSTDRGHLRMSTIAFTCNPETKHLYCAGGGRDLNMLIFIIRHFKNPRPAHEGQRMGTEEEEDIGWLKKWLVDEFGFEESGCIKGAGTKFKRLMNMTYMTKETKWQPIDGNVPDPLNRS